MAVATDLEFAEVDVAPVLAAQMASECTPDPASIAAAVGKGFGAVMGFVMRNGLTVCGQPRTIYTGYGAGNMSFVVAMPVAAGPAAPVSDPAVFLKTLEGMRAYRFSHHGPYAQMGPTYDQITAFMKEKGLMASEADWAKYMPMWEEYQNDPQTTPADQLLTYIYLPVQ